MMRNDLSTLQSACGQSFLHPQQIMAHLLTRVCPGRVVAVANRQLSVIDRPSQSPTPGEVRRVARAVSVQMMRWGADLCFHQAAALLAQCIPGVQLPLGLFNAVRCLSAAMRWDLLQTVEAGLCAAVAQPDATPHLRALLGRPVMAGLQAIAARSDVVVGLALCALLLERLQSDHPTWPQTRTGRAVAGSVAALRILSNVSGAHEHHGEAAHRHAVMDTAWSSERRVVAGAFPHAAALLYRPDIGPPDDGGNNWGVDAKGARRRGNRPVNAPGGGHKGHSGKAAAGVQKRRRIITGMGGHAHAAHAHRRDTFSPPDGTGPVFAGAVKHKNRNVAREQAEAQEAAAHRGSKGGTAGKIGAHPRGTNAVAAASHRTPPEADVAGPEKACLRFDRLGRARHQIRQLPLSGVHNRVEGREVLFCVHRNAVEQFKHLFPTPAGKEGDIVAFMAIAESGQEDEMFRMYGGLDQLLNDAPRRPVRLGDYGLFSVATISVISDASRRAHHIRDDHMLASGQFAVLRTARRDGGGQDFLAFFARRSAPERAAMNFGFSRIDVRESGLVVAEDGLLLESDSLGLENLIPRIEDMSGLRQAGTGTRQPDPHRPVEPIVSNHLFIRLEATPSLPVDREVGLLRRKEVGAVTFAHGTDPSVSRTAVYFTSFQIADDAIFYVDRNGRTGALYLESAPAGGRRLTALPGAETEFMREHGLQGLSAEEGAQVLKNYGFNRMPAPDDLETERPFPLNGFRIRNDRSAVELAGRTRLNWDGRTKTFAIHTDAAQVDYVDGEGRAGVLALVAVRYHPDGCVVLQHNQLSDLLFARRAGLVEHREYTWRQVRNALFAVGLVER